jgi:hypothetical protein
MLRKQYHELQLATQTLDTIDQLQLHNKPKMYVDLFNAAQESLAHFVSYFEANREELSKLDHPYWNDDLAKFAEEHLQHDTITAEITQANQNADYILHLYNNDLNEEYPYYPSEEEAQQDIYALRAAGFDIKQIP